MAIEAAVLEAVEVAAVEEVVLTGVEKAGATVALVAREV